MFAPLVLPYTPFLCGSLTICAPLPRYSAYHPSHPTLTERLRALEGYKAAAAAAVGSAAKKEL